VVADNGEVTETLSRRLETYARLKSGWRLLSMTTFFDKSDSPLARTVFERDTSGKVVAQIYRGQGQRLRARRV
jgi:hypothetical protein